MKSWQVLSALASSAMFAWGGLVAQTAPTVPVNGINVEGWIGTGGSLGILASLLYYLITKHNPRQDERYDKLVTDNAAALAKAHSDYHAKLDQIRNDNNTNVDKLADSIQVLTQKIVK